MTNFWSDGYYNMLRTIKANYQPNLSDYTNLHLPNNVAQLLVLYENEEAQFIRMCILSKIKQNIISYALHSYHQQASQHQHSQHNYQEDQLKRGQFQILEIDEKNPNTIFSALFLRFLKRGYRNRSIPKSQLKLFYHIMSLAIKYFYNEDQFKFLFNEITELIQNHKERIQTALDFFIEVIATIEYNYEQYLQYEQSKHQKISHCKFQRHFTTNHLNSMLMIANFFMEKAILRDNQAVEDGLIYENFKMKASEEHIQSILQLLHKVLCFDFIGEKYSDNQENVDFTSIIIPTKNTKYSNLSQFQKWLKNSDWIRIYQFIYHNSQMLELKLIIIQLLGDMSRIHMKYFKNKNCYRVHIENIIYALADILEQAEMIQIKDMLIRVAIGVGRNLLKLTSSAIVPILFDININLFAGLLQNIKTFIVDQIIIEEIFNANIIYYFFKFVHNLHLRCLFQKNNTPFQIVQKNTREICRNYQNYFRLLLKKLFKNSHYYQKDGSPQLRQDYSHLKDSFENYDIQELMIYLSPFKFMKPRYTSANSVQELFILTCAKFNRSVYIFQTLTLNIRERQFALQMIEKSILQIIEWFAFTAYSKNVDKEMGNSQDKRNSRFSSKFQDNFELNMEPISEQYGQQIENQYEYCHMLRVICFFMLECLNKLPIKMYKQLNKNNEIFKLINLTLILCFQSDLQQTQNSNHLNSTIYKIIEQKISACQQILLKLFVKQWQYSIYMLNKQKDIRIYSYKFNNQSTVLQLQFIQIPDIHDQTVLLQTINKVENSIKKDNPSVRQYLKKISYLLAYNIARQNRKQMIYSINSIEDCQYFFQILNSNITLVTLLQLQETTLLPFFYYAITFVRNYQIQQFNKIQVVSYLKTLSCMAKLNLAQIQQEAINKMFLFLTEIVPYIRENQQSMSKQIDQIIDVLHQIDSQFIKNKKDLEFQCLHHNINGVITRYLDGDTNLLKNNSKSYENMVLIYKNQGTDASLQQRKQQLPRLQEQIKQLQLNPKPQQIYNGYHRQITMSILDKYCQQSKEEQLMDVQPVPQYKQQIKNSQQTNVNPITDKQISVQSNNPSIINSLYAYLEPNLSEYEHKQTKQLLLITQQSNGVLNKLRDITKDIDKIDEQMYKKNEKQQNDGNCDETKLVFSDGELQISQQQKVNQ